MTTNPGRWLLAFAVSTGLLALLLTLADFSLPDFKAARPEWLAFVFAAHLSMLCSRGLLLRSLSTISATSSPSQWVRLAARHQTVFTILPSGAGDLGFPVLAKRFLDLGPGEGIRLMVLLRQRDLIVLLSLAIAGLALVGCQPVAASVALVGGAIALWFSNDIFAIAARILSGIVTKGRLAEWLQDAVRPRAKMQSRAEAWVLTVIVWAAAIIAILSGFAAAGQSLSLGGAFVFIALINFAGLIAISIAGLGVTETGAAGALVLTGRTVANATATALLVRPALLVSVLAAALLLDLALGIGARARHRT